MMSVLRGELCLLMMDRTPTVWPDGAANIYTRGDWRWRQFGAPWELNAGFLVHTLRHLGERRLAREVTLGALAWSLRKVAELSSLGGSEGGSRVPKRAPERPPSHHQPGFGRPLELINQGPNGEEIVICLSGREAEWREGANSHPCSSSPEPCVCAHQMREMPRNSKISMLGDPWRSAERAVANDAPSAE
jgi:hypothetical protein